MRNKLQSLSIQFSTSLHCTHSLTWKFSLLELTSLSHLNSHKSLLIFSCNFALKACDTLMNRNNTNWKNRMIIFLRGPNYQETQQNYITFFEVLMTHWWILHNFSTLSESNKWFILLSDSAVLSFSHTQVNDFFTSSLVDSATNKD